MHCTYRQINGIKLTDGCPFTSERFSATYHYTYFPLISTILLFGERPASAYMSHLSSSLFLWSFLLFHVLSEYNNRFHPFFVQMSSGLVSAFIKCTVGFTGKNRDSRLRNGRGEDEEQTNK